MLPSLYKLIINTLGYSIGYSVLVLDIGQRVYVMGGHYKMYKILRDQFRKKTTHLK